MIGSVLSGLFLSAVRNQFWMSYSDIMSEYRRG
jgi:hypothetical protein